MALYHNQVNKNIPDDSPYFICTKCNLMKPRDEFQFRNTGRPSWCKLCHKAYQRDKYVNEGGKEKARLRYAANPEPAKEAVNRYQLANKDKGKSDAKLYRENNRDKVRATLKRWKEANPDRANGDPENKRIATRRRRAKKKTCVIIPYSKEQLEQKLSMWGGICWICKVAPFASWDHVKPISKGGADMLSNLRPACGACNSSKGATWPFFINNLKGLG